MFRCRYSVIRGNVCFRNYSTKPELRATEMLKEPDTTSKVTSKDSLEREIFSSWKPNTLYNPLDFIRSRSSKTAKRRGKPFQVGPGAQEALRNDAFRQLDIDPLKEVNNGKLFKAFITSMGKIQPRSETGLSWRSQRKVSKAIKRAKQKGVLSLLVNYGFTN